MVYKWLDWLADELRAEGCKVVEEAGWKSRGRPSSSGQFDPYGQLLHHTGTTSSASNPAPTLNMCINGRSDLPGPLAHAVIGYDGTVHVIAAGRANHAGPCDGWGPFYDGDGNAQMVGWEIDYNGTQPISDAQLDAATRASAAVLRRLDRDEQYAAIHAETSSSGKWDTGGVTGDTWRARIRDQLAGDTKPPPKPKGTPDMIYCTSSDGRGWLIGVGVKTLINTPATRAQLLAAGVPNAGTWSGDVLSEFTTWESAFATIDGKLNTIINS